MEAGNFYQQPWTLYFADFRFLQVYCFGKCQNKYDRNVGNGVLCSKFSDLHPYP